MHILTKCLISVEESMMKLIKCGNIMIKVNVDKRRIFLVLIELTLQYATQVTHKITS